MKKIVAIVFLLLLTGCGCNNEKVEEEYFYTNKANLNDKVINDQVVEDVKFYDTSVIYDRGITTLRTTLKSDEDITIKKINVVFKNQNGSKITTLEGYLDKNVKNETDLVITSDIDLTDAYSIEYVFDR